MLDGTKTPKRRQNHGSCSTTRWLSPEEVRHACLDLATSHCNNVERAWADNRGIITPMHAQRFHSGYIIA